LPDIAADTQSRYIEAAVNGVLIAMLYAPNGNPQPGPKFKHDVLRSRRASVPAVSSSTLPGLASLRNALECNAYCDHAREAAKAAE
jgi:hypothetical protein